MVILYSFNIENPIEARKYYMKYQTSASAVSLRHWNENKLRIADWIAKVTSSESHCILCVTAIIYQQEKYGMSVNGRTFRVSDET